MAPYPGTARLDPMYDSVVMEGEVGEEEGEGEVEEDVEEEEDEEEEEVVDFMSGRACLTVANNE